MSKRSVFPSKETEIFDAEKIPKTDAKVSVPKYNTKKRIEWMETKKKGEQMRGGERE